MELVSFPYKNKEMEFMTHLRFSNQYPRWGGAHYKFNGIHSISLKSQQGKSNTFQLANSKQMSNRIHQHCSATAINIVWFGQSSSQRTFQ
jgi:hypothetical protein